MKTSRLIGTTTPAGHLGLKQGSLLLLLPLIHHHHLLLSLLCCLGIHCLLELRHLPLAPSMHFCALLPHLMIIRDLLMSIHDKTLGLLCSGWLTLSGDSLKAFCSN